MQLINLEKKNILITGASDGIGKSTAILLDKLRAKTILVGRDENKLTGLIENLSGKDHSSISLDLNNETELDELVSKLPKLDGVVFSAGIYNLNSVYDVNTLHIDEIFDINFRHCVLLTTKILNLNKLNKYSSLVYLSSIAGQKPFIGGAMYSASKAALEAYCRNLALELAPQYIRANCVCPGLVKTAIYEQVVASELFSNTIYPLGIGEPNDVANAIAFLLSDASKWITGISLPIDGGVSLSGR